jgi:hypothetical protein
MLLVQKWGRCFHRYLREHGRAWITSALLGIGVALAASWIPHNSWVYSILAVEDWLVLGWSGAIIGLGLCLAWSPMVNF